MRWRSLAAALALGAQAVLSCTCERQTEHLSGGALLDAGVIDDARAPYDGAAPLRFEAGTPVCVRICTVRDTVACARPVGDCAAACATSLDGPCGPAWSAYYDCAAARPTSDYSCNARGQPDLVRGICSDEHAAVERCLFGR
jgi:hypothetical protein